MQVCANCHGALGRGNGAVAEPEVWKTIEGIDHTRMPRDLVQGYFRYGDSPTAIKRTLLYGVPTTAMSGYKGLLSEAEVAEMTRFVLQMRKARNQDLARRPGFVAPSTSASR